MATTPCGDCHAFPLDTHTAHAHWHTHIDIGGIDDIDRCSIDRCYVQMLASPYSSSEIARDKEEKVTRYPSLSGLNEQNRLNTFHYVYVSHAHSLEHTQVSIQHTESAV